MKKKILILTSVALLVLAIASMSFAYNGYRSTSTDNNNFRHGYMMTQNYSEEELEAFHETRILEQKIAIASYLEEGKITQEQHDNWLTHIEDMETFHEENGFGYGFGYGGCHRTTEVQ